MPQSDLAVMIAGFNIVKGSRQEQAQDAYSKLLRAKKFNDVLFLVIGKLLIEIRDKELYKELDYDNFTAFMGDEKFGFSQRMAWEYISVYENYVTNMGLSEEYVATLPVSRLSLMTTIVKDLPEVERRDKIDELSLLRREDFMIRVRQSKANDRPRVYFNEELKLWHVEYYADKTKLCDLGNYDEYMKK